MGKNKLKKFKDMEGIDFVFQYPFAVLRESGFPLKGKWSQHFGNDNPIVLELGCGKGEYAVGMAREFPDRNFVGVDIKGARMWTGATEARREGISNVAFLRTNIELIAEFFEPGEVSEIWITFPDPQMRKERKRLTGTRFLDLYRRILKPGGLVHLKTDSPFLYTYTHYLVEENNLKVVVDTDDLYAGREFDASLLSDQPGLQRGRPVAVEVKPKSRVGLERIDRNILDIKTYYELQWLSRGLSIKYICFELDHTTILREPSAEIPVDTYRSFSRGELQTIDENQLD